MKRNFLLGLVVVSMLGMSALDAYAGDKKRRGTAGAAHLLVPVTARNASLGASATSGLSDLSGLEAIFSNPAGLVNSSGTGVIFSRMEYVADIGVNYFGVSQNFGQSSLAFTVTSWDFGDIPLQTEIAPEKSSVTFNSANITAGLTYARQFTDRIAAGATFKVISETIDDISGTAVAIDAGMTYVVGESGLRLGVSLKNIGSELTYDGVGLVRQVRLPDQQPNANNNALNLESEGVELPSLLNFGVAYTREMGAGAVVTVLGNFRSNSFEQDQYSGGIEINMFEMLDIRGGYEVVSDSDLSMWTGSNFGVGLNMEFGGTMLHLDYAYRATNSFFDNVQMFTLGMDL